MKKIRVGILFGGKSAEHEVSLLSARNVVEALDRNKFEPVLIGIDKTGAWHLGKNLSIESGAENPEVALLPGTNRSELLSPTTNRPMGSLDVVFPVLHGPLGEDGSIQGLLRLADLPFVGAGVLGSAIGMDKDVMKRLLRDAGIPIARFLSFNGRTRGDISYASVTERLGLPCFIKPANMGSSVGVAKAIDEASFDRAVEDAFRYDTKIVIEEAIIGDEIECSVLGNDRPAASLPGRISVQEDFYSYETKYVNEDGARMEVPAQLPAEQIRAIQELAIKTFTALECAGMARVDMFLTPEGRLVVNEINTIPGFTKISMYPKLWEASGLSYTELITRLIELAIERFEEQGRLQTSFVSAIET